MKTIKTIKTIKTALIPPAVFPRASRGAIIAYVLIFGSIFILMLAGLLGYISLQLKQSSQKVAWNQSLQIAEAGIEYYRWCVNNGVEENCSGQRDYYDAAGRLLGAFSVAAESSSACGQVNLRRIVSSGWAKDYPAVKRTVRTVYGRESVAKYSYVLNANVWIGDDHQINGPYHSNGGIRMDGGNRSLMTSAAIIDDEGKWVCTGSFGCCQWRYFWYPYYKNGYDCTLDCPSACTVNVTGTKLVDGYPVKDECVCPGIFSTTANPSPDLFKFPVPPFDFNGITVDLGQIKERAANGGGIYFPVAADRKAGSKGYHVKLREDGKFEVYFIMALQQVSGYSEEEGDTKNWFIINNEQADANNPYTIPPDCAVLYFEDNLWIEGTVRGKITVVSANLISTGVETSVVLPGNIQYADYSGANGLALIGQKNVLIGPQSPDDMILDAVIVAQKGRFGRNHYEDNFRDSLTIRGSVISNGRVGTQWTSGGQMVSGYAQRYTYSDQGQVYNPPPFVMSMGSDYKIVSWEEME